MLLPYLNKDIIEAGCDEAGRGCLAGAVYAAAVILPPDFHNELLNDSKQLTERQRYQLREVIEREAVAWAVGVVTPEADTADALSAAWSHSIVHYENQVEESRLLHKPNQPNIHAQPHRNRPQLYFYSNRAITSFFYLSYKDTDFIQKMYLCRLKR